MYVEAKNVILHYAWKSSQFSLPLWLHAGPANRKSVIFVTPGLSVQLVKCHFPNGQAVGRQSGDCTGGWLLAGLYWVTVSKLRTTESFRLEKISVISSPNINLSPIGKPGPLVPLLNTSRDRDSTTSLSSLTDKISMLKASFFKLNTNAFDWTEGLQPAALYAHSASFRNWQLHEEKSWAQIRSCSPRP